MSHTELVIVAWCLRLLALAALLGLTGLALAVSTNYFWRRLDDAATFGRWYAQRRAQRERER